MRCSVSPDHEETIVLAMSEWQEELRHIRRGENQCGRGYPDSYQRDKFYVANQALGSIQVAIPNSDQ